MNADTTPPRYAPDGGYAKYVAVLANGRTSLKRVPYVLSLILIMAGGCGLFEPNEADFMPLAVDNRWTFEYVGHNQDTCCEPDSTRGSLTWHVVSRSKDDDTVVYTVKESFDGMYQKMDWSGPVEEWKWPDWEPHSWERLFYIREGRNGLLLDMPFAPKTAPFIINSVFWSQIPVPRTYATSADTISQVGNENAPFLFRLRWRLVRNQGIVFFEISQRGGGPGGVREWSVTLVDHNLR